MRRLPDHIHPVLTKKKYGKRLLGLFTILLIAGIGFGFWYENMQKKYKVKSVKTPLSISPSSTVKIDTLQPEFIDDEDTFDALSTLPNLREKEDIMTVQNIKNDQLIQIYNQQESKGIGSTLPKGTRPISRSVGLV